MRVLHAIDSLGSGGAERSLCDLLPIFRAAGIDSAVVCGIDRGGSIRDEVLRQGVSVHIVGTNRLVALARMRQRVADWRPHIVHTTLFESDILGRVASFGTSARVLTSLVSTTYDGVQLADARVRPVKLRAAKTVDRLTAQHLTDHFHAISHAVKDSAITHLGLEPEQVTVIERGRDLTRLGRPSDQRRSEARARLAIPADADVVLNVGRQEPAKGHATLVEATAKLATRRPGVVLLQVGREGKETARLRRLASHAPEGVVRFLGHRDDVGGLLAAADVFVFPSVYEGLGGSVLEAMAMRVPVVASHIPALSEVLDDGRAGELVPVGDPSALAQAIEHVLDHRDEAARMAERAERIFFERFTLERSAARMVELYDKVLEGAR